MYSHQTQNLVSHSSHNIPSSTTLHRRPLVSSQVPTHVSSTRPGTSSPLPLSGTLASGPAKGPFSYKSTTMGGTLKPPQALSPYFNLHAQVGE